VSPASALSYTLPRLLGLHNLSGVKLAGLLEVSTQYVSLLMKGERRPTPERLRELGDLFGIDPDRLATARFEELLQKELADPQRYFETEERIRLLERARQSRTA
jgi:transcriptional regulator with XRE-family HTH domain